MLSPGVIGLLFFRQNIRYAVLNHKILYMPFSVYQVTSSPPKMVWLTIRLSCGASGISAGQPPAPADCYAPLFECSSFDLNALDPMAWIDEPMRCFCGKRPPRPITNQHSQNLFMVAGRFIIAALPLATANCFNPNLWLDASINLYRHNAQAKLRALRNFSK